MLAGCLLPGILSAQEQGLDEGACAAVARTAGTLMKARQAGVPIAKMLEPLSERSAGIREAMTEMVIAAYEKPRFNSPEFVQRSIEDFANDQHLACLKSIN